MKFHVPDMSCGHCTATIDKSLKAADPSAQVSTDLTTRTIAVTSKMDAAQVQAVLEQAGYPSSPVA